VGGFDPNEGWIKAAAVPGFKARLRRQRLAKLTTILRLYPHRLPGILSDQRAMAKVGGALDVRCRMGRLQLDRPHAVAQLREIVVAGAYAAPGFVPRTGWRVVDVGANLGFYSAWAMSFMRSGDVVAIEAVPDTYKLMRANLMACRPAGVRVATFNFAVADRRGAVEFVVPDDYSNFARAASHLGTLGDVTGLRHQALQADTLDGILGFSELDGSSVNLLKIDVEGSEADCLSGAVAVLQRTERVVLEHHSEELLSACSDLLEGAGFRRRALRLSLVNDAVGTSFWSR